MQDFWIRGRCLRFFFKRWALPYGFHRWGLYAFGVGPFGFMFWPKQ